MNTGAIHVEITSEDERVVGPSDDGTRIRRQHGSEEQCADWFDYIHERFGNTVSPGGVSMFLPVSRAAVHKRLKSGKLTAFLFHVTHRERTFFGRERSVKAQPYVYIPVSECKAWAAEVALRPENLQSFLRSLGASDEGQEFLERDPGDKGNRSVRHEKDMTIPEVVKFLFP